MALPWTSIGLHGAAMTFCHGLSKRCYDSAIGVVDLDGSVMGLLCDFIALSWAYIGAPRTRCSTVYPFMASQWAHSS